MELHAEAYRRVLSPFGVEVLDRDVFEQEGARSETIIADYLHRIGRDDAGIVERLSEEKQSVFQRLGPPGLYAGAETMVRDIREATPRLGLVTGTRRVNVERLIPDLLPLFDAMLTQSDYERDKPDPEPYARTAERLGVPPSRCAAVENAARGVMSAKRAGYAFVAAITTTLPEDRLRAAGADVVVGTQADLAATVVAWLRGRPSPRGGAAPAAKR